MCTYVCTSTSTCIHTYLSSAPGGLKKKESQKKYLSPCKHKTLDMNLSLSMIARFAKIIYIEKKNEWSLIRSKIRLQKDYENKIRY